MGRPAKYPFNEMAIGDVVKFPAGSPEAEYPEGWTNSRAAAAAHQYTRRMKKDGFNVKMSARKLPDGSIEVRRVK